MIKIHPLASLDADDLKCILAGYVSSAVYTVVKTETREHAAIALQLTPRSPPYVKHYDPIDDNTLVPAIDFYRAVGFAVEGIDLSYYTNDDLNNEVAVFMKRRLT